MEADVFIRTEIGQAPQVAAREVRMLGGGAGARRPRRPDGVRVLAAG
jgi:hypothetical protein